MDYRGLMTHDEIFDLYRRSRVMIDMSFSRKFAKLGSHFNRSLLESYNCGLVPICTDVNMEDAFTAQITLWKPGKTHIKFPYDAPPSELAYIVENALSMKEDDAMQIVANGRRILKKYFEYRKFAQDLILLAKGEPAGVYPRLEVGTPPAGFYNMAKKFAKEKAK
jgi:hypothetical protein